MKCFHPQTYNDNVVSCGRCGACRENKISAWVVRLENHSRHMDTAHFITLTYAENKCKKTKSGRLTIDWNHLKQFFKRLKNLQNAKRRKNETQLKKYLRTINLRRTNQINYQYYLKRLRDSSHQNKTSYYAAAEYGSHGTRRPHYHIIMFNTPIDLIDNAWSYKSEKGWVPRGSIYTGDTYSGSIRYTLKYISKPSRIPQFRGDDRTRESSRMSKGIGKDYITERIIKWHKADLLNRYYVPGNGGIKIPMPRYYADKIYTKSEKAIIAENMVGIFTEQFYNWICKDIQHLTNYTEAIKHKEKKLNTPKLSML